MENKDGLFRQSALERLSSPERLDQLMKIISPMDWIALTTLGTLVTGTLLWSIVGRIPITVDGRGVFIQPRQIVDLQSNIAGQLSSINVRAGQCVEKDEIIATIESTDLKQQLRLSQGKLAQLQSQAQDAIALTNQRMQLEKNAITANRISLMQRLRDTRTLTPVLQSKGLDAIQEQRRSLEQRLRDAQAIVPVMQRRVAGRKTLVAEGAIAQDSLLQVEQEFVKSRQDVADIEAQLKQLDVQITQTERQYLENLRSAGDIQAQLQDLDSKVKRLDQERLETQNQRNREIQEVNREIARLEQQITLNSKIISPKSGCVLELTTAVGQVVQPGMRVGRMQLAHSTTPSGPMTGIIYFPIKDGKQVKPAMTITITPDTVQRERFGGIVARITNVSTLPITREGATSVIGNAELVQTVVGQGGAAIEVSTNLEKDSNTKSGYRWSSSKGPDSEITPGTTATARVTIEERAPITFVLPFLRDLVGLKE
jgi:HlyD family secretion protein